MENTPVIETERLLLRKFTQSDIEVLFLIFSDREVNTFLPMFPLTTLKETELFFEQQAIFRKL